MRIAGRVGGFRVRPINSAHACRLGKSSRSESGDNNGADALPRPASQLGARMPARVAEPLRARDNNGADALSRPAPQFGTCMPAREAEPLRARGNNGADAPWPAIAPKARRRLPCPAPQFGARMSARVAEPLRAGDKNGADAPWPAIAPKASRRLPRPAPNSAHARRLGKPSRSEPGTTSERTRPGPP